MAANINSMTLAGNIGKLTTFTTAGGMMIVTLNIVVNTYKKVGDDFEKKADWFTVKVFGKSAEKIEADCIVGDNVFIQGRLSPSSYEKEGAKHYTMEVIADKISVLAYGPNSVKRSNNSGIDDGSTGEKKSTYTTKEQFKMAYKEPSTDLPVDGFNWEEGSEDAPF